MKIHEYNEMMSYLTRRPMSMGGRVGFKTAGLVKTLLSQIKPYTGARKIGESTKKDRGPEKKFLEAFFEYARKEFDGNKSAALRKLGINREKYRSIEASTLGGENRRIGNISEGGKMSSVIPTPKKVISYADATTEAKRDKNFLKKFVTDKNKNEFYTAKDIGNILKIDVSNKKQIDRLVSDLNRFNVNSKQIGGGEIAKQKKFRLGDAVNKITKGYEKKLVEGEKVAQSERVKIATKLDPEQKNFNSAFLQAARKISQEEGIFIPGAIEDVGHPLSIKITDKYPKLVKDSNINKLNTLVYQDPVINRNLLEATGYESKHDKLFKQLNKIVGKKVGPEELKELQGIKNEMNNLHATLLTNIKNLSTKGATFYDPRLKKSTTYKGSYFKEQENRVPKIDINIPKVGQTFKSENLFVDMSNVNPAFRVGLVDQINPNAKFFKDLNKEQKEIYKRNVLDQTKFNLDKFYSKAGYPREQIDELKDALEFGTAEKLGIATAGVLGLGSTAAADEPGAETPDDFPTGKVAAGAAVAPLATKKGRSVYGKAAKGLLKGLQVLGQPSIAAAIAADELAEGNIKTAGASLLAPELVGSAAPKGTSLLSKAGRFAMNPFGRAARAFTPVGLATIGAGGLYDVYKEFERRQALTDEERLDEDLEAQEKYDEMMVGAADGGLITGRMGFAEGPKDPSRRKFIKIMGGLASLPIVGKYFKLAEKAAPVVQKLKNTSTAMPEWFPNFVQKFMNNSIGKKIDADIMEFKNPDLPNVKITRHDDGRTFIDGKNEYNEGWAIDYKPPGYEVIDETTGKAVKTKGEFEAVEGRHVALGPEDYDTDPFYVDDLDELTTIDVAEMEKYTTGKVTKTVKDAFGQDTGLKKGPRNYDMAVGTAENKADVLRDADLLDEID